MTVLPSPPPSSRPLAERQDRASLVLVLLALVVLGLLHGLWISWNLAPPAEDDNMQLMKSLDFHRVLGTGAGPTLRALVMGHVGGFYPHLAYGLTSGFYRVLGVSEAAARLSLLPWVALLGLSTWGLGRRLGGPWVGAAAALATLTSPIAQHYSHSYFLDLPLTAAVAFHLWAGVASEGLRERRGTLAWGLSLAVGLMTKWTFAVWILVPDGLLLGGWLFRERSRFLPRLALLAGLALLPGALVGWNLLHYHYPTGDLDPVTFWAYPVAFAVSAPLLYLGVRNRPDLAGPGWALFLALVATLPWYLENVPGLLQGLGMAGRLAERLDTRQVLQWNWFHVQRMLYNVNLLLPLGLAWGLSRSEWRARTLWLAGVSLSGFLLISLGFVQADRYALPVLPALAVLLFNWVGGLGARGWVAVLLLSPVWLWQALGWLPGLAERLPVAGDFTVNRYETVPRVPPAPGRQVFHVQEALGEVLATTSQRPAVVWIMTRRDRNAVQGRTFEFYTRLGELPLVTVHAEVPDYPRLRGEQLELLDQGTHFLAVWESPGTLQRWRAFVEGTGWRLEPLRDHPLPGNQIMSIFRRVR